MVTLRYRVPATVLGRWWLPSVVAAPIVGVLVFIMIFVGFELGTPPPSTIVTDFLEAATVGDWGKARSLTVLPATEDMEPETAQLWGLIFSRMSYDLKSVKVNGLEARVIVDLETVDGFRVASQAAGAALLLDLPNKRSYRQELLTKYFTNALTDPQVLTTRSTSNIYLVRTAQGWRINANDELMDRLTGGLTTFTRQLSSK